MPGSELEPLEQPSDMPGQYIVIAGGLLADQATSHYIPLRVIEVRPTTNAAGKLGYSVFCETWRGEVLRYTFSNLKQNAGIVQDLREWLTEAAQSSEQTQQYQELLTIRETITHEQVERLRPIRAVARLASASPCLRQTVTKLERSLR